MHVYNIHVIIPVSRYLHIIHNLIAFLIQVRLEFNDVCLVDDILSVYDGATMESTLLSAPLGCETIAPITTSGANLYVRFTANHNDQVGRFQLSASSLGNYCSVENLGSF